MESQSGHHDATSVQEAAHRAFLTPNALDKAHTARQVWRDWQASALPLAPNRPPLQDRPGRPDAPLLLNPGDMPKRRKGGSLQNRQALIHAVAHIELNAIDLALDMTARFGHAMPRSFTQDWLSIADDEARHFLLLSDRLGALGCAYGDFPAHDGLWQAAYATRQSLDARLAVVPMVLEARGLDVTPGMINRLKKFGDVDSAAALEIIYQEEVRHVAIGTKWFKSQCQAQGKTAEAYFQQLVSTYFHGILKRPFNDDARLRADLTPGFYEPLAG